MKKLVVSAIGSNSKIYDLFLLEWIISLRCLANYQDEVLLLDYGINHFLKNILKTFDVNLIPCSNRGFRVINNVRYVDVIPILGKYYRDYNIVFLDIDIWFQCSLTSLFKEIQQKGDGVIHAVRERSEFKLNEGNNRFPRDKIKHLETLSQFKLLYKKFNGDINGGFLAGNCYSLVVKLNALKDMYANMYEMLRFCTDQFYINMLYDFEKDSASKNKWNVSPDASILDNGVVYTKINNKIQKAVGIHCPASSYFESDAESTNSICQNIRFSELHRSLFNKYKKGF